MKKRVTLFKKVVWFERSIQKDLKDLPTKERPMVINEFQLYVRTPTWD